MDTLYDLLGALPQDDAETLRVAFRKAVKGTHPDIRPGDPDAAARFREIVRANEILGDRDQRAAYDHLLLLAQIEKDPASAHPIAARIHKLASGVLALASVSIVSVGGYLLFLHMSMALVAPTGSLAAPGNQPASTADLTTRLTASIAAVSPQDAPDPAAIHAFLARADVKTEIKTDIRADEPAANTVASAEATAVATAAPASETDSAPQPNLGAQNPGSSSPANLALPDPAPDYVNFFQARGVSAYGNGDVSGAISDLDQAVQLDPKFTTSYVDRGILFFREKQDEHAFPDLQPLKRAEKPAHAKPAVTTNGKSKADALPKVVPLPQPRIGPRSVSKKPPYYASSAFQ